MKTRHSWKSPCVALMAMGALTVAAPAQAANVTFSATLDLSAPGFFNPYGGYSQGTSNGWSSISAPVTIGAGDSFSLTYTFLAGQSLHAATLDYVTVNVWDWNPATLTTADGAAYSNFKTTGTISLLGADGSPVYSFAPAAYSGCCVQVGGARVSTLTDVTFYGVKYEGVLDEIDAPRRYNLPGFGFTGTSFAIVAPPVPEPSTWAMMILGFCGLGLLSRRRNRTRLGAA